MYITILALGTRGDVQPLLALGLGLQAAGHTVEIMAGRNFAEWVRSHGFGYVPAVDMEAVMKSEKGVIWAESSDNPFRQLRMMAAIMREHRDEMIASVRSHQKVTDLLISGFVSEPMVQSYSEKSGIPYVNALLQPTEPTASGAASLTPVLPRRHSAINRLAGHLAQWLFWSFTRETTNYLRRHVLDLPPHSNLSYLRARRRAPTLLGASRHVVPPPVDWPDHTLVTGYWFLDESSRWRPSVDLLAFLDAGPPPVYIGFGSMSKRNPQETLDLILAALRESGQRGLVAAGWGDIHGDRLPAGVFTISGAPHDWLFERVAGVVHHGGAGTTAAGLRAGKPMMIIPQMADQPYWGRRVYELGVGVRPIPRHKITAGALALGIGQLTRNRSMQAAAEELGQKIREEQGVVRAVEATERFAGH